MNTAREQLSIFGDDAADNGRSVNPDMLIMARESRAMTQKQVSELTQRLGDGWQPVSQANISKYESRLLPVGAGPLRSIAKVLGFSPDFFYLTERNHGFGTSCTYHRKQQSMLAGRLKTILAEINIHRIRIGRLLNNVDFDSENRFFRLDLDDHDGDVEKIAGLVRSTWQLPFGPVPDLIFEIERAGGIVVLCPFGTRQIDAVSQWIAPGPPIFYVNAEIPTDRLRWTLAHELGHIIMHRIPTEEPEREADRFAAEFLMPAREIGPSLADIALHDLERMKAYWRTSMQSILRRAHDLGRINDWRYRKMYEQIGKLGMRMKEPLPLAPEHPQTLSKLVRVHEEDLGFSLEDLSALLMMPTEELLETYPVTGRPKLRLSLE